MTDHDARAREIARELTAAMQCAACGALLPNPDCGQAKNAYDYGQPKPCSLPVDIEDVARSIAISVYTAGVEDAAKVAKAHTGREAGRFGLVLTSAETGAMARAEKILVGIRALIPAKED